MNNLTEQFPGTIAKGYRTDNAITICYGRHFNGSGDQWPCLTVEVGFQEHETDKMLRIGKQTEALLRREGVIQVDPLQPCREPCDGPRCQEPCDGSCDRFNNWDGSLGFGGRRQL